MPNASSFLLASVLASLHKESLGLLCAKAGPARVRLPHSLIGANVGWEVAVGPLGVGVGLVIGKSLHRVFERVFAIFEGCHSILNLQGTRCQD